MPNDPIVAALSWLSPLFSIPAEGGKPAPISTLDASRSEIGHWFPNPLPDGRHILMTVWTKSAGINDAEVGLLDLDTGKHTILFKGAEGRYLEPGFIVYFRAGAYHAIRFNPETLAVSGDPVRVLEDAVGQPPEGDGTHVDLSSAGTLAYVNGPYVLARELAWITEGGKVDVLPFPKRPYARLALTSDGRRIAVGTLEAGRYLLRLLDLDRPTDQALDLPGSSWSPAWHPDGKRLAFVTMKKGDFDSYMVDVTSSAPPTPVLVTESDESPIIFMPDGTLVVRQSDSEGRYMEKRVSVSPPGKTEPLTPALASNTAPSSDGTFIAFESDRSGTSEIYVRTTDVGGAPEKVSSAGGTAVVWAPNGRELLYLREPEIMAVRYTIENGRFRPGAERVWARVDGNYHPEVLKVAPDGRALVAIDRQKTVREIRVIVNWQSEIAKKLK